MSIKILVVAAAGDAASSMTSNAIVYGCVSVWSSSHRFLLQQSRSASLAATHTGKLPSCSNRRPGNCYSLLLFRIVMWHSSNTILNVQCAEQDSTVISQPRMMVTYIAT